MGKVEALGLVVAMTGVLGAQSAKGPSEAAQITMAEELIGMSRTDFDAWCSDKGSRSDASLGAGDDTKATCAWVDSETGEVWHSALHFDAGSSSPRRADAGLLHASAPTVLRLVHNAHGATDGESVEGFPLWRVDVNGREGLLAVAEYDEITLVQVQVARPAVAVSMR